MNRKGSIFWGLMLVAAAVLWITNELGILSKIGINNIGVEQILFTILWVAIVLNGLFKKDFFQIFMGLAFLGIVWDKQLKIEAITPWPIIGAAILLTIGFSFIFGSRKHRKWKKFVREESKKGYHYYDQTIGHGGANVSHSDGEYIKHVVKMSGSQKYIDSQNLKSIEIEVKAGGAEVYMDKAKAAGDKVFGRIEVYGGGLEIYIPRDWKVDNQVNCFMGAIDGIDNNYVEAVNDTVLVLTGNVKAGGVEIIRV